MNTIQFNQNDLALTATLLGLLQSYGSLLEKFANLGGSRYVISGCDEQGGNIGTGWVVIDGELMEVPTGGIASGTVYVRTTDETVNVQDGTYKYTVKELIFGSGANNFPWSEVKRIDDLVTLKELLDSHTHSLSNSVTSNSTTQAANVAGVKLAYDKAVTALSTANDKEPKFTKNTAFNLNKSDSVATALSTQLATSQAVKTAYDKGVSALTAANGAQSTAESKMPGAVVISGGDLNNYMNEGHYYCNSISVANALGNCPVGLAFNLDVNYVGSSIRIQRLTTYTKSQNRVFVRSYEYYNGEGVWGAWLEQTITYTSLAQLGLADGDFSPTDWDSNVRLIFNAMAPKSTFKAGLCGAGEVPILNASLVASRAPFNSPALEFNREVNTSAPCLVWAKNNNSPRQAYYNIDNAGSAWMEVMLKDKDTGTMQTSTGSNIFTNGVKVRQEGNRVVIWGVITFSSTPSNGATLISLPSEVTPPTVVIGVKANVADANEQNRGITVECQSGQRDFKVTYMNGFDKALFFNITYYTD